MSKITKSYIEARRDGIKWLNSQKRDYSTGVNILTRSGYKGFVAARLARQGEKPHTREKLEYEIRPIRRLLPKSSMISVNAIMSVHASIGCLPNWVRPIRRLYVQNARILSLV